MPFRPSALCRSRTSKQLSTPPSKQRCSLHSIVHETFAIQFEKLGYYCATYPSVFILTSVLFALVCGGGMFMMEIVTDYDKVWYPRKSLAFQERLFIQDTFQADSQPAMLLFEMKDTSTTYGVLDPDVLAETIRVNDVLQSLPGYNKYCYRAYDNGACVTVSITDVWNTSISTLPSKPSAVIDILSKSTVTTASGVVLSLQNTLGSIEYDSNGTLRKALALQSFYALEAADEVSDEVKSLEKRIVDSMLALRDGSTYQEAAAIGGVSSSALSRFSNSDRLERVNIYVSTERSFQDESDKMINADMPLVAAAVVLMIIYVSVMLGGKPPVTSRVGLGVTSVLNVGLALLIGFGLGGYFGNPFNVMSQLAIFVLFGIGIDDMFIMVDCFDRQASERDPRRRLALAMREAGPTITLTSLTDLVAFLTGVFIDLPAIQQFCITASISVAAVFVMQCTFFAPIMIYDIQRQWALRYDIVCCYRRGKNGTREYVGCRRQISHISTTLSTVEDVTKSTREGTEIQTKEEMVQQQLVSDGDDTMIQSKDDTIQQQQVLDSDGTTTRTTDETIQQQQVSESNTPTTRRENSPSSVSSSHINTNGTTQNKTDGSSDTSVQESCVESKITLPKLHSTSSVYIDIDTTKDPTSIETKPTANLPKIGQASDTNKASAHIPLLRRFMQNYYAPLLRKKWLKYCVLLVFAAGTAAALYNALRTGKGIKNSEFLPDDSYLKNFMERRDLHFGTAESNFYWFFIAQRGSSADSSPYGRYKYLEADKQTGVADAKAAFDEVKTPGALTYHSRFLWNSLYDTKRTLQQTLYWTDLGSFESRISFRLTAARARQLTYARLPVTFWFERFESWEVETYMNSTGKYPTSNSTELCKLETNFSTGTEFVKRLRQFLIESPSYQSDVVWLMRTGQEIDQDLVYKGENTIDSSELVLFAYRITLSYGTSEDMNQRIQSMKDMRAVSNQLWYSAKSYWNDASVCHPSSVNARALQTEQTFSEQSQRWRAVSFGFELNHQWYERYEVIDRLAIQNLGTAAAAVMVVVLMFHPPINALFVCLCVVLTDIDVIGLMYAWDLSINVTSLVILVMAVGFSVDYSAHIAEAFANSTASTRDDRAVESLTNLGVSVLNGGLSTFLAVVVLAFTKSAGFRVLFKMFFGLVVFGLLHGLVLLPIMLSLWGPTSSQNNSNEKQNSSVNILSATSSQNDRNDKRDPSSNKSNQSSPKDSSDTMPPAET